MATTLGQRNALEELKKAHDFNYPRNIDPISVLGLMRCAQENVLKEFGLLDSEYSLENLEALYGHEPLDNNEQTP